MMKQEIEMIDAQVSALADGQLHGDEFASTVAWLGQVPDARQTWHVYHLVGDVLRAGAPVDSARDADFLVRLRRGLQQESPQIQRDNAIDLIAAYASHTGARGLNGINIESANESHFRWKWVAGLASLAAVSVLGWQVFSGLGEPNGVPLLARLSGQAESPYNGVVTVAGTESQIMLRDPRLDALLAAHQQFGGTSALQMPSGFLRNATFEGAAR